MFLKFKGETSYVTFEKILNFKDKLVLIKYEKIIWHVFSGHFVDDENHLNVANTL